MEIKLNFENKEELKEFISAFNNALISYNDVRMSKFFGCETSSKWDKLPIETMEQRVKLLNNKYFELLNIEKTIL